MSDIEDTKQCTNCKLEIPSGNFTIHSIHCQRNFYLCSKCDQPVNYSSRVDHDEANHTVVHCTNCQLELEKYLLDDHLKNDCPDRDVKCQICDIEVKANDIAEHENYCGSRTEKCGECGEFVMLKYKSLHIDSNHTFIKLTDEPGPSPSWQYGRRTLCNFMPDLSKPTKPAAIRKRRSSENFRKSRNSESSESKDDSDEISKRNLDSASNKKDECTGSKIGSVFDIKKLPRDLDEWPALSSLRTLQISDEKYDKATLPSKIEKENNSRQNQVDEDSDFFYAIQVSHEINSDIWRKEVNKEDETLKNSFKPMVENNLSTEKLVEKDMFEKGAKKVNQEATSDISNKGLNLLCPEEENVKLPCEFCGNLIASNFLLLHQSSCSLYLSDVYSGRSESSRELYFDEDLEQKIACGNCNRFFRLPQFENHQLYCHRNPVKSLKNHDKFSYSKNLKAMNMKSETGLQNGLEPSSPQLTRVGTRSEWLSELSKSNEAERGARNNLTPPESGVVTRTTKVSRKTRRAPSPPRR